MQTPRSGIVGIAALFAVLVGTTAWIWIFLGPVDLARGLLGARRHLRAAETALARPAFEVARYEAAAAAADVDRAHEGLHRGGPLLELARLVPRIDDAMGEISHLVTAAKHSARAAGGAVDMAEGALAGPDRILAEDPEGRGGIIRLDRIEAVGRRVSEVKAELGRAETALEAVDAARLPRRAAPAIERGIREAIDAQQVLQDAEEGLALLPGILGAEGPRTYLIGMQNPAEQRGTGGAILQFATLEIDRGKPALGDEEGSASTVYDIDQDRQILDIPLPEDAWYQRGIPDARRFGNANWSPHWPLSARLLVDYGNASAARSPDVEFRDPDGVIAVDPLTVERLMPAIGPYDLRTGHRITAKNVVNFVLYRAYAEFPGRRPRRAVLRQVVDGFYEGLLDASRPARLMSGLATSLGDKNIQIYMEDEREQAFVEKMGWAGSLDDARRKAYVLVAEQNVGGNKLDLFADVNDSIEVEVDGRDADVSTEVRVRNNVFLPQPSWVLGDAGAIHRPMINLYAPRDAVLQGWSAPEACPPAFQYEMVCRRDAPEPARWASGPPTHEEVGKTVWSGTIEIPAGREGELGFDYRMPGVVRTQDGRRTLVIVLQQQPKVRPKVTEIVLRLPDGADAVRAPGFRTRDDGSLVRQTQTRGDVELTVSWRE